MRNGQGRFEWGDGRIYEGPWVDGKQHGQGKFTDREGRVRMGEWEHGKKIRWIIVEE
jgi:hypothetical protein